MRYTINIWGIILIMTLYFPASVLPQEEEYAIKAAYLERLTRFIKWPASSDISDPSEPFVICVVGRNPFGPLLEKIYAHRKIRNKTVRLIHEETLEKIPDCHLAFISESAGGKLPEILSHVRDRPILTVGDTQGFAEKGVIVNFYLDDRKVRFEINESAARATGLSMSYKLLRLARIIRPLEER